MDDPFHLSLIIFLGIIKNIYQDIFNNTSKIIIKISVCFHNYYYYYYCKLFSLFS
jgi:hypothetical protein